MVTDLSGVRKENPMPPAESDQFLAEEFPDFSLKKLIKYRKI